MENSLLKPGQFVIGCNYWASHAGTAMWRDWDVETVEKDLQELAENGMQVLRVFPLWPDFQPITRMGNGRSFEYRFGEQPLPDDEAGKAGVSQEAIEQFRVFSNLAHEQALLKAVEQAEARPRRAGSVDDFLGAFDPLVPAITRFFEAILVMADDVPLRKARLGLLQRIADLSSGVADLSRPEGF